VLRNNPICVGPEVIVPAQRKGNVIARVIDRLYDTISRFVNETISDKVSLISTDEASVYRKLPYPHDVVYHGRDELHCWCSSYQHDRKFLVDLQTRRSRHVPQK